MVEKRRFEVCCSHDRHSMISATITALVGRLHIVVELLLTTKETFRLYLCHSVEDQEGRDPIAGNTKRPFFTHSWTAPLAMKCLSPIHSMATHPRDIVPSKRILLGS